MVNCSHNKEMNENKNHKNSKESRKMKGLIAIVVGAAVITAIFVFGANAMLDDVDARRGKNKQTETTVAVATESATTIHDVFAENDM